MHEHLEYGCWLVVVQLYGGGLASQLVERVVCEVHEHLVHVFAIWRGVWLGTKAREAVVEEVGSERVH